MRGGRSRSAGERRLQHVNVESWNEYDEGSGIYAANPGAPYIVPGSGNLNTDIWSEYKDPMNTSRPLRNAPGCSTTHPIVTREFSGPTSPPRCCPDRPARMKWSSATTATELDRRRGFAFGKEQVGDFLFGPILYGNRRHDQRDSDVWRHFSGSAYRVRHTAHGPDYSWRVHEQWSMLQENVGWFGDELTLPITVPEPARCFRPANFYNRSAWDNNGGAANAAMTTRSQRTRSAAARAGQRRSRTTRATTRGSME